MKNTTTTVSVLTRHTGDCPKHGDPTWRRCKCRKSLYIYEGGKVSYLSARTRSWEQAEKVAQAERDKRDPVRMELAKIAAANTKPTVTIGDALDRWQGSKKAKAEGTKAAYAGTVGKICRWAQRENLVNLSDVTTDRLDKWRGQWSENAADKLDRIGQTSQSILLGRLSDWLGYCHRVGLIDRNPSLVLESIPQKSKVTLPLTQEQYQQVLDAAMTAPYGTQLVAIITAMRWTGLRIGDVLALRHSDIVGNRLRIVTQKTGSHIDVPLPTAVLATLSTLPTEGIRLGYYFWAVGESKQAHLATIWSKRTAAIPVTLRDEHGKPMRFHSHMLRDTFAVELLLAGMPLDKVSRLLTHASIRTTEKYYAHWSTARREQLESEMTAAMRKMGAKFSGD